MLMALKMILAVKGIRLLLFWHKQQNNAKVAIQHDAILSEKLIDNRQYWKFRLYFG
jgi:hypothetical protein